MHSIAELVRVITPVIKKYRVNTVYLFGSRAEGTSDNTSDYDLAFLFKEYSRDKHNHAMALDIQFEIEERLNFLPVDVVFIQAASLELRFEIIKRGKVIYCVDDDFRTDFEDVVIRDYLDFKPFIEQYRCEVEEAIREGDFFA